MNELSLEDLSRTERLFLIDNSALRSGYRVESLSKKMFKANTFSELPSQALSLELRAMEKFLSCFSEIGIVYTLPHIAEQFLAYHEYLDSKRGHLEATFQLQKEHIPKRVYRGRRAPSKRRRNRKNKFEGKNKRVEENSFDLDFGNRGLLKDLCNASKKVSRFLFSHIVVPDNQEKYEALVDLVREVSIAADLKKTFAGEGLPKKAGDYTTDFDERFAAMAMYLAFERSFPTGVISSKTNHFSLLFQTPKFLGANVFLPYNEGFRRGTLRNFPPIYFPRDNNLFEEKLHGEKGKFFSGIRLSGHSSERNRRLEKRMFDRWVDYSRA